MCLNGRTDFYLCLKLFDASSVWKSRRTVATLYFQVACFALKVSLLLNIVENRFLIDAKQCSCSYPSSWHEAKEDGFRCSI